MNKPWLQRGRYLLAVCLLLSVWAGFVNAGNAFSSLADPTKPPEGFGPVAASANSASQQTNGEPLATAGSTDTGQTSEQALTLIRIDVRTGQGMAVLNGRMVRVGDRIGDARVIAINATGVELATSNGKQKYSLWEKTSVADLMTDAASKDSGKDKP
jgi:hypothetical protein